MHTSVAKRVLQQAERVILLSGTPSICRPFDMCGQLHVLQPQRLGSWLSFKKTFAFRCGGARCCMHVRCCMQHVHCDMHVRCVLSLC